MQNQTIITDILSALTIDGSDHQLRHTLIQAKLTDLIIKNLGEEKTQEIVNMELENRKNKSNDYSEIDELVMNVLSKVMPDVNLIENWEHQVFYRTLTNFDPMEVIA